MITHQSFDASPVRRVRVLDEQTVIPITDRDGKPYKGYMSGGNEFADVWRMPDGDGSWKLVVIPKFHANQPSFDVSKFRPHPAAKRLMRLHIDDMGAFGEGPDRCIVRVRKISNSRDGALVWLDEHNETNVDARLREIRRRRKDDLEHEGLKEQKYSARGLQRLRFRKVSVDEVGRVRDPGPRT